MFIFLYLQFNFLISKSNIQNLGFGYPQLCNKMSKRALTFFTDFRIFSLLIF